MKMRMNIVETDFKENIIRKPSKQPMELVGNGQLPMLTFPSWNRFPKLRHGFSTRLGGVSEGIFSSLNLSFVRGDEREAVMENYRRVAQYFGTVPERLVASDQTHADQLRVVTGEDAGKGITREKDYEGIDGLLTREKNLVLVLSFADCVPLYFYDPVREAIALSHSGWKGTVLRIGEKTIRRMEQEFGSRAEDIYAAVGPSICQECYEVGEEVAKQFLAMFPEPVASGIVREKSNGKFQLDLWRANEEILLGAGIKREHLSVTDICTCCNPKLLFSHRASKGKRGNLGAFLMMPGRESS